MLTPYSKSFGALMRMGYEAEIEMHNNCEK
jgi:hypothetical protein